MEDNQNCRILVVDDDGANRLVLSEFLNRMGYTVVTADDGFSAIESAQSETPDLILMDIDMPGMNGIDAAAHIKDSASNCYTPLIYVTAMTANDTLSRALDAGGDDFVTKPIDFPVLESKINAHLRIRDLSNQLHKQNEELKEYNFKLEREHDLIESFFENVLSQSFLDPERIKYYMSSMSAFNGDILLSAKDSEENLYVLVGDFTGHGLSAAMGTMPVAQVFFGQIELDKDFEQIIRAINNQLELHLPYDMFFAACLVKIPASSNTVSFWLGGLPDIYLRNAQNQIKAIESNHMPLGILNDNDFECTITDIDAQTGDKLFIYTDGIIETGNDDGDMYGYKPLEELFHRNPENLFESILEDVRSFRGENPQLDDITLVELRLK